jgi:predicted nucleic acid-binding protein
MAEIVLDANVLVALLDAGDVHHRKAHDLLGRLRADGHAPVLLDVLVGEAVSVLCRRAMQRSTDPPDVARVLRVFREWFMRGEVRVLSGELDWAWEDTLAWVDRTSGALNFNDAFIVVLHQNGLVEELASFDAGFDLVEGLTRHR